MFFTYRILTIFFFPLYILLIYLRKILGKEDDKRYIEKFLISPNNYNFKENEDLIWFHGASIGEITSIIPLIDFFLKKNKKILVTSTTLSSGRMIEKRFKNEINFYHHYFPFDLPYLIKKFLNNWKPFLIIFVDSEIWPNFLHEIKRRKINLALVNGRITNKTFSRWSLFKEFAKKNFSSFDLCLASSKDSFESLKRLGSRNPKYFGNLKYISNQEQNEKLDKSKIKYLDNHKVWCAASTHKNEEIICIEAHNEIKKKYNNLITIIIPRHIHRNKNIISICKRKNLKAQILNEEDSIKEGVEIILVNSFGNISKYYDYCKSVFIGKSLIKKLSSVGGQNPIEAAKKGCKVYHGPFIYNFLEVYEYLNRNEMAKEINNYQDLSKEIILDLQKPKNIDEKKIENINRYGQDILKNTIQEINQILIK